MAAQNTGTSPAISVGAVYAGTFDPLTNGHRDVIERAARIFSPLVVAVAESSTKGVLFKSAERKELIEGAIQGIPGDIRVEIFEGLLVDYCHKVGLRTVIRGLRAVSDYEYEAQMAMINRDLAEDIETVFLMTSRRSSFISSSVVRDIAKWKGDLSKLVPPNVAEKLRGVFGSRPA